MLKPSNHEFYRPLLKLESYEKRTHNLHSVWKIQHDADSVLVLCGNNSLENKVLGCKNVGASQAWNCL